MKDNQIRQELYRDISKAIEGKEKVAVAWSGGPRSGLIIGILKELGKDPIVIYADDTNQRPEFYLYLQQAKKKYNLNLIREEYDISSESWDQVILRVAEKQGHEELVILTGRPLDFGVSPVKRDGPELWNFTKTYLYPFYQKRKSLLG